MSAYDYLGIKRSHQKGYKDAIRRRDDYTCRLCGKPGYDVDHIIPWWQSHDSSESNLRALCHQCNVSLRQPRKDAKPYSTLPEWFDYIQSLAIKA